MRIAYLCTDFGVPVFGFKGASIHVREMVEAFRRDGHTVRIFSPAIELEAAEGDNRFRASQPGGLPEVSLRPVPPAPAHADAIREVARFDKLLGEKTRVRQELRNLLYNLEFHERVLEDLRREPVDFVYERYTLASFAGIRVARELGVPHVLEVNAPLAYEQEKMRGLEMKELARDLERRIYCDSDRLIVVSRELREFALSCGVPEERIEVVPNSVDPARFEVADRERAALRERYDMGDACVIGFVGGLKPWHGTETLLEAFAEVRRGGANVRALIVGDGPQREPLENLVRDLGIADRTILTGKVPYAEIPTHLAAMDVAVAPYTPNENFYFSPIKVFEYMAAGRAVAAGAIGQCTEIVDEGRTGRLYPPGDVGALAVVLRELAEDPEGRARMGCLGREWIRAERTWDHNARRVAGIAASLRERTTRT